MSEKKEEVALRNGTYLMGSCLGVSQASNDCFNEAVFRFRTAKLVEGVAESGSSLLSEHSTYAL